MLFQQLVLFNNKDKNEGPVLKTTIDFKSDIFKSALLNI